MNELKKTLSEFEQENTKLMDENKILNEKLDQYGHVNNQNEMFKLEITELKSNLAALQAHNLSLQSINDSDKEEIDKMKKEYTDNESKSQILLKNHISQLENENKSIRIEMAGCKSKIQSGQSE